VQRKANDSIMSSMTDFSLKKWYLDAADDQGNVFIGYWISMHWRSLFIFGYQYLWHSPRKGLMTQSALKRHPEPFWQDPGCLVWRSKDLSASWETASDAIEQRITSEKGEIEWHCLQPRARTKIELPQCSFSGWGYTEYIDIKIPIWNLPFKTLYWGRSHTDKHYLVWIKLDGTLKLNIVWSDGKPDTNLLISDTHIKGSDFDLELGENVALRQGQILSTVLQPFQKMLRLFPSKSFLLNEQKWYNQGLLKTGNTPEKAITIYEKVTW
jgi:hypothetical protein